MLRLILTCLQVFVSVVIVLLVLLQRGKGADAGAGFGAGANARASIGIAVFSGMLASTCLAVLFVPSFFVILQRWQERRKSPVRAATPGAAG